MIRALVPEPKTQISLHARDVSNQKRRTVNAVPCDATVGELTEALVGKMGLPERDVEGRPLSYHVRLEREGRHLHASETVGDALKTEDDIVLQPNIMAGGR